LHEGAAIEIGNGLAAFVQLLEETSGRIVVSGVPPER
jgi:hypothetical protein